MKRLLPLSWLTLLWVASLTFANSPQAIPPLTGYVVDGAGVLSAAEREALSQQLARLPLQAQVQMAVLLVNHTAPESIESYSIRVVEDWKLGVKGQDRGLLLLVALKEHRVRLEVGRGLEGVLPDAVAKRIVAEIFVPELKKSKNLAAALNATVMAVADLLVGESKAVVAGGNVTGHRKQADDSTFEWLILIVIILVVVMSKARAWRRHAAPYASLPQLGVPLWIPPSGSNTTGPDLGGSGEFSGGGASDSWGNSDSN
jgi:uncharacterized protein